MSKWDKVKIGDIFQVTSGGTPSRDKPEYYVGGTIPWVKTGDLKGKFANDPDEYITTEALKNSSAKIFPKDTVLLAMYGATIGACSILPFEAATNQACGALLPSNKCNVTFLYYFLKSIKNELINKGVGGAQPNISGGIIKDVKIPLPPLATQQKIAAILDAADELRQKDKALVAKYDELTQVLFIDMFGDPVTNPKGWEKVPFGNHIDVLTDYHANGSYETLNEHVTLKNTTDYALMVRTTDLEKNNFDKDVISISEEAYNYLEKTKVFGGEMIINKIGSAGKVYMMPYLNRPVSLGMNAFMLRFKNTLNSTFIFFQLKTKYGEHEINKRVKGAVTKTIRKDAVREIPIILAPLKLQNQFAERVKAIEEQKSIAQASALKSEELFNSLLQKAFNGELV
jgi:type I restriction enzyme S subunit